MSENRSLFSSMSATSLLGGVFRNERHEAIYVKQAEARGMTARLFASLFLSWRLVFNGGKAPIFVESILEKVEKYNTKWQF